MYYVVCTRTFLSMASFLRAIRKWVQIVPLTGQGGYYQCKFLPSRKPNHVVLSQKSTSKLMFPLCSACDDTTNQGDCTHSDEERCIVGKRVADGVRKALEMDYDVVELFEFWENTFTCFDKDSHAG